MAFWLAGAGPLFSAATDLPPGDETAPANEPPVTVAATPAGDPTRPQRNIRIIFPGATVNDLPAKIIMDTGSTTAAISEVFANKDNLKFGPPVPGNTTAKILPHALLEDPARLEMVGQTFTEIFEILYTRTIDGLVGWQDMRNNILVFDADQRQVSVVEQLPPETATWLKLKIKTSGQLLLEIPQADGKTGALLVDTGSPFGVGLPPTEWQAWKAEQADAPSTTASFRDADGVTGNFTEVWANEMKLGPIDLTDVPVHEVTDPVVPKYVRFVGSVGMYVLARMDLVLDGKNGYAYLRPRAAPGPPYPGITRPGVTDDPASIEASNQNWVFTGNLTLKNDYMQAAHFFILGNAQDSHGDWNEAIASFDQALALAPDYVAAYLNRGITQGKKGDYGDALADFDQVLHIEPEASTVYSNRGIIKNKMGDLNGAIADLSKAVEFNPTSANVYVTRGVLRSAKGDKTGSMADFAQALALEPQNASIYFNRGLARENNGDLDGAIADLTQSLALNPKNAAAYYDRALAKDRKNDRDGGISDYDRAIEIDPKMVNAFINRGYDW
ncbi:MAG TPA: tetratricopeptide repeat protein, partial [Opitutales bacterium]|nr:tetratricopeptide repeat protein [Opitutales bacterium]